MAQTKERTKDEKLTQKSYLIRRGCNYGCDNYGGVGSSTVFAADNTITPTYASGTATAASGKGGSGKVTITLPKTQGETSNTNSADNTTYTYKVYKVFDAVPSSTTEQTDTVSYSVMSGKRNASGSTDAAKAGFTDDNNMATYFTADSAYNVTATTSAKAADGSLSSGAVSAIEKYLGLNEGGTPDDAIAAVTVDAKHEGTATTKLEITGLPYGYYYITTTTGSVVTVDTTHPNAEVDDKNSVPSLDKTITDVKEKDSTTEKSGGSIKEGGKNAIAEVGSTVSFQSVITVGKGAKNYVFMDKMDNTLTLDTSSIAVKIKATSDATATTDLTKDTDYTLDTTAVTTGEDKNQYTFKISFDKDLTGDKELAAGKQIVITYNATVNSSALQEAPGKNRAVVEYGDGQKTTYSETNTYNAKITVTKNFEASTGANLTAGNYLVAGFKLYKTVDGTKYYYKETTSGTPATVSAVTWTSDENEATELKTTKDNNQLNFAGLPDGSYTLTESTVPDGYNQAADQTFEIKGANEENAFTHEGENANLIKSTTILNSKGSLLPSTGGIGTTIFYVIGGVLIAGAAILLITRRKKA